jgi:hypothetical protein
MERCEKRGGENGRRRVNIFTFSERLDMARERKAVEFSEAFSGSKAADSGRTSGLGFCFTPLDFF